MRNLVVSELLKTKRSPFLLVVVFLPLLFNFLSFIDFYFTSAEEFRENLLPGDDLNPWFSYDRKFLLLFSISLPLVVSVLTFVIKNIEDKANGWRSLFILPYPIFRLYLAKYAIVVFYCLTYLVMSLGLLLVGSEILSFLKPDFHFSMYPRYLDLTGWLFVEFVWISMVISSVTYACVIYLKRTMAGLLLSIFLPFFLVFLEFSFNPYSQAFTRTQLPMALRSSHIRTLGNADGFVFSFSFYPAYWYLLGWVLLAWLLLYVKSKRPAIDYN